jgi:replication factor C subunit 3/5
LKFRVNITESGQQAVLALAGGDLRRVLNLLQSAQMAYPEVTEEAVYLTAGAAMPKVIDEMFRSLMNDGFETAYLKLQTVSCSEGFSLLHKLR